MKPLLRNNFLYYTNTSIFGLLIAINLLQFLSSGYLLYVLFQHPRIWLGNNLLSSSWAQNDIALTAFHGLIDLVCLIFYFIWLFRLQRNVLRIGSYLRFKSWLLFIACFIPIFSLFYNYWILKDFIEKSSFFLQSPDAKPERAKKDLRIWLILYVSFAVAVYAHNLTKYLVDRTFFWMKITTLILFIQAAAGIVLCIITIIVFKQINQFDRQLGLKQRNELSGNVSGDLLIDND